MYGKTGEDSTYFIYRIGFDSQLYETKVLLTKKYLMKKIKFEIQIKWFKKLQTLL